MADISTKADSILLFKDSWGIELEDIDISDISQLVIEIKNSVISQARSFNLINCDQGIKLIDHSNIIINSSAFENVGNTDVVNGGTILSSDSNITIEQSDFRYCKAKQGGCLALLCSKDIRCESRIHSTKFYNSIAEVKGGAIYYDLYRPTLNNISFSNNSAQYGNDIASYPIQIKLKGSDSDYIILQNVVSGQIHSPAPEFELVDHDRQIILTDNTSTIRIKSMNQNTTVAGTLTVVTNMGGSTFNELILTAKPGSKNIEFEVISTAIDNDKLDLQYNGTHTQHMIDASFRYCQSGEIEINDQCQV